MVQRPVTSLRGNFNLLGGNFFEDGAPIAVSSARIVTEAADLAGDLSSTELYLVDGVVDMGSQSITVPEGGLTLRGQDFGVSGLVTSEPGHTLFVTPAGGYSGTLLMRDMYVQVDGAGSQVFDLDNQENGGAVECTDFNFVRCESFGTLTAYRQGLWSNFATIACADGLTIDGTWSGGFAILTSIIVAAGVPFTGTLLKKGPALLVNGSVRSDMNALQLDAAGAICDFAPANIVRNAEFRMSGVRCNPAATPFPNMPASSVKARYSNCVGFRNTYVGAQWSISAEAATTIAAVDAPVKVAGTTAYSDQNWFSSATDNAMTYDGSDQIGVVVHGELSFTGTNGNQINVIIRQWDDSAAGYVDLGQTGAFTMNAAGRAENIGLHAFCDMNQNDRIEIWVENKTAANDVTAKIGGIVSVSERPS